MIEYDSEVFRLSTENTSYWFRVTKFGHLEHLYFGAKIGDDNDPEIFSLKRSATIGDSVIYDKSDDKYCLEHLALEWSDNGRGDYRSSPTEIKMPDKTFVSDFVYKSHEIFEGCSEMQTLPSAYGGQKECSTLIVHLTDVSNDVGLALYYTVYEGSNVVTRRAVLTNNNEKPLVIRRIMSMSLDMPNKDFKLVTLDGGWIKEAHRHDRPLQYGIYVNSSNCGASGNTHNPGFMLAANNSDETYGEVYGFNLVYSGNHCGICELSADDVVRIQVGINPHCFEWQLNRSESFETPEAVMTYSSAGFGQLSLNFHEFVNNSIVRGEWKNKERPVLLNNWEAYFFKFTRGKLIRLAKRAKKIGVELFVLDDGWFGARNSDSAGLGDYTINRKKLPRGLDGLCRRINGLGMKFGLWFEPEMVNEDSELFRTHPEYAVVTSGKTPVLGRNQLVLDLCNKAVRDYIVDSVGRVLDSANIEYVKWDMNRRMSDACSPTLQNQGEFYHRYIIGLYDILKRIFEPRPHILFESCGSGGKRFDLGMLCYSPQIWTSDDTDPIERLAIQGGLSYFYPLSAMGSHVSEAPHQQTLRDTPLATRFNVAAFGCLGYELDLKYLNYVQKKEIKAQVKYYKLHRKTLQYGAFYRQDSKKSNKVHWQCVSQDKTESVAGFFQTLATASEGNDYLPLTGLDKNAEYTVKTKPQSLFIKRFGGLVKHLLPVTLDPNGFIVRTANKYFALTDCVEEYSGEGRALMSGVMLNNQFMGSYYNDRTRLLGDFGSNLYDIEKRKK
ncbi:MAG: alpha-galactosidase [Oscillospiraceae bacterium]